MKTLLIVMLVGSLFVNGWLLRRSVKSVDVKFSNSPGAESKPSRVLAAAAVTREIARGLESGDVALLRAGLIAAGADDATVRALVEGVLRRRYEEQAAAWRIERIRNAWWLGGTSATGGMPAPSRLAMVREPLHALLGSDPLDLAEAELRYDFLPAEKRRLLAMIDLDYADMQASAPSGNLLGGVTKSELDERDLLVRERKKDTLAALNAEERAEYEFRFSRAVTSNAPRFAAMEATEREFRTIIPVLEAFDQQTKGLTSGAPSSLVARVQIEQRAMDQLVATLGYERALDYCWAVSSGPYLPTVRLMREENLPISRAAQLLQLAAETGVQAGSIHDDTAFTPEQKRAALAALQTAVRPQLDALVPPAAQSKLKAEAFDWFTALGEGRYARFRPVLSSNGWMVPTTLSVSTPPRIPLQPVPLPRRSPN